MAGTNTIETPATAGDNVLQARVTALTKTSHRLAGLADSLSTAQLRRPAFPSEWTIAQVFSHLGNAAEICTALVERGLSGDPTPPQREQLVPIWERWDAMTPEAQIEAWRAADDRHRTVLSAISREQAASLRIPYFVGPLTLTEYVGYRLSEHSVHAWDIAVALDPKATIPADELDLLWQRLDLITGRFFDKDQLARLRPRTLDLELLDRGAHYTLELGDAPRLSLTPPVTPTGSVAGTSDALLRLTYGRHQVRDPVTVTGAVALDDLQNLFPGF
jgi:uncharacterized protein (TIGR03083 family)